MARLILTGQIGEGEYDGQELLNIYCGLDCCVTLEVFEELRPQLTGSAASVYDFSRSMTAPALEMMLRGLAIDERVRHEQIEEYTKRNLKLRSTLDKLTRSLFGIELNHNSPKQLAEFFYKTLNLPEVWSGIPRHISTDRKALEKCSAYLHARPFINCILALRDCSKVLGVLRGGVDSDGRIRTSYNVAGTETGRFSSSENAFGTGTNLQNITGKLRQMFVGDPGKKLGYFDLEQAESRAVGIIIWMLFNDPSYIDACESGDLHTSVSRDIWPSLGWTGDPKRDRAIADQLFYREFSYRDLAKRGGHGTNYYGTPPTMAKFLNVETKLITEFQRGYFAKFPGIQKWHQAVATALQTKGVLSTFMGRERHFFGRLSDDVTLREAIAYEPQSVVADIMNKGILQVWRGLGLRVSTHAQVHDAGIFQYPAEQEDQLVPQIAKLLEVPLVLSGRKFLIPVDVKTGWNWQEYSSTNPNGLRKFKGHDERLKLEHSSILHRVLC